MPPRSHPFVRLVLCVIGTVFAVGLVMATTLFALFVSAYLSGKPLQGEIEGFFSNDANKLISTVLTYPFVLFCLIGCRRLLDRRSFPSLGLRPKRAFPDLAFGALCGALAITFLFGILWVSGLVSIEGPSPEAFEAGAFTSAGILLLFAGLFFCVGFMEEISFRGYALHNLNAWLGWRGAVIGQAIVFAIIHPLNELQGEKGAGAVFWDARWALVNIFLIAVFFAQCYRKTGSLWFPIGFHAAWNFFLGCVWSLPVSGIQTFRLLDVVSSSDSTLSGGSFGAEGSIFLTFITAALVVILHRMPDHPQAILDLGLLVDFPKPDAIAVAAAVSEEPEEEESGPSRFKTSMRPASSQPQLPPEFFRTEAPNGVTTTAVPNGTGDESFRIDVKDDEFINRAAEVPSAPVADRVMEPEQIAIAVAETGVEPIAEAPVSPDSLAIDRPQDEAVPQAELEAPKPKKEPRW